MGSRNPVDSQNHRKEEKTFLQENGVDLMIRVHDTGIGMAITDQLVQLMGGEIVVESLKDKGYYYDAVKLQQMVATPDMVHKTLAEDHNLMDAEQIMDTGNDMDTAVAEVGSC